MAMEPLPLGFEDFSIAMDPSLASLWPLGQDLHCNHRLESVQEVKERIAAANAELEAAREQVRIKEKNIAAIEDIIRQTTQERDLLREQYHLLLVCELETMKSTSSDSGRSPLASSSPVAVDGSAFLAPPPLAHGAPVNEDTSAAALAQPEQLADKGPLALDRSALFEPSSAAHTPAVVENRSVAARLELLAAKRPLPQKGRMLQAVMGAGPLLQNRLVAPPLPRWRNPPTAQTLTNARIPAPSGSGASMGLPWSTHYSFSNPS